MELHLSSSVIIRLPDLDGSVRQDLPITGPVAVVGAVAGCRLDGACRAEARLLWTLIQVFQGDQLLVLWLEMKLPYPVDLHK